MTQTELKQKLYELVSLYFGGATIVWGMTNAVQSKAPLITLRMGNISRPYQPIRQNKDGISADYYPSKTTIQIDLFTSGVELNKEAGITAARENTAVNDMTDFVNFINSVYVDDWSGQNDISILANEIHDLTELVNSTQWQYRAMVELEIGFTQCAVGNAAIMNERGIPYHSNGVPKYDRKGYVLDEDGNKTLDDKGVPIRLPLDEEGRPIFPNTETTPSEGRTQDLGNQSTGWFEQVQGPEFYKEEEKQ